MRDARVRRWVGLALTGLVLGCGGASDEAPAAADIEAADDTIARTDAGDIAGPDSASEVGPEGDVVDAETSDPCAGLRRGMVPGPCQQGFDAELEAKAERFERQFHLFNALPFGVNTDLGIATDRAADRALIESFLTEESGWDFEGYAGRSAYDVITSHHKVAGLYAGVGIMADAFRYGVLRDQGYPTEEVDRARAHLVAALETLHMATAITGVEGVIVRGLARTDLPGDGQVQTTPLFDAATGAPLPIEKNNGTWRDDNSGGQYPDVVWEDSVSRDQLIGWVGAMAAAHEVMTGDDTFDPALLERLAADAKALGHALMVVRPSGYDLEVPDADGRTTLHGYLNEHNLDGKLYSDGILNGFHAIMALGVVAAYAVVSGDPEIAAYLTDKLLGERQLHLICRDEMMLVDMGLGTNYSNVNMAFMGAWLALRYIADPQVRAVLREALERELYGTPDSPGAASPLAQSLFDFIYAAGMAGQGAMAPLEESLLDTAALERGLGTLRDFPDAPYFDYGKINCPAAECTCDDTGVDDPACVALDGTPLTVLGCVGRNCDLITVEMVPMRTRGPSNYHWRSNPYKPNNGGEGGNLLPGVDFRIAYWLGRFVER